MYLIIYGCNGVLVERKILILNCSTVLWSCFFINSAIRFSGNKLYLNNLLYISNTYYCKFNNLYLKAILI